MREHMESSETRCRCELAAVESILKRTSLSIHTRTVGAEQNHLGENALGYSRTCLKRGSGDNILELSQLISTLR